MPGEVFSAEERLVVLGARTGERETKDLAVLLEQSLDWEYVLRIASEHAVASLLAESLGPYEERVPEHVLEQLRRRSSTVATRNLRMLQEVASLSNAFAERGIRAIPYRGPIVAEIAYGRVGAREFGDLDFLLPHQDLSEAREILSELGYEAQYILQKTGDLTSSQQWAYVTFVRDYPFRHRDNSIEVELHWRIVSQHFPTGIDLETVWDRRSKQSIAGTDVPVLSHEDRLLMLCVHGTRHRWERLQWICDVAEYLQSHSFDWDAILERGREHNCERMILLGLSVAEDILDAPLPERIRDGIEDDSAIPVLQSYVQRRLFDQTDHWSMDLRRYQSKTLERYRDKGKFWTYWAFKPDRRDIEMISLPRSIAPLYSIVRLGRLATGATRRLTPVGAIRNPPESQTDQ